MFKKVLKVFLLSMLITLLSLSSILTTRISAEDPINDEEETTEVNENEEEVLEEEYVLEEEIQEEVNPEEDIQEENVVEEIIEEEVVEEPQIVEEEIIVEEETTDNQVEEIQEEKVSNKKEVNLKEDKLLTVEYSTHEGSTMETAIHVDPIMSSQSQDIYNARVIVHVNLAQGEKRDYWFSFNPILVNDNNSGDYKIEMRIGNMIKGRTFDFVQYDPNHPQDVKNSNYGHPVEYNWAHGLTNTYYHENYYNSDKQYIKVSINDGQAASGYITFQYYYSKTPNQKLIGDFVDRLYNLCLGRNAEPEGKAYWIEHLSGNQDKNIVQKNAAYVVQGFFLSPELINKNLSSEDYIKICYKVMLNREAEPAGLKYWSKKLDDGMSLYFILKGFIESPEFTQICNDYGIIRGGITTDRYRDKNQGLTSFVNRLYTQILGRKAEMAGLNEWCRVILGKYLTPKQVATFSFFHSPEFLNKNTSDEEFVKICYRTFLDRQYEKAGLDYYLNALKNGTTRDLVIEGFANSPEFLGIIQSYGLSEYNQERPRVNVDSRLDGNDWRVQLAYSYLGRSGSCTFIAASYLSEIYGNYRFAEEIPMDQARLGDWISYDNGGLGIGHDAIYLGNGLSLQGNYAGTTVIRSPFLPGATPPRFFRIVQITQD